MKRLAKRLLQQVGLALHREPLGTVTGWDLERDLALVLRDPAPHVAIDVGANDGHTIDLIRRVMPNSAVHAFEPNPATFEMLRARHARTPGVTLNHAGVGAVTGSLELNIVANHALNSFLPLTPDGRHRLDVADRATTVSVPVLPLDTYAVQNHLEKIDLLKIDTQGFEMQVLAGATPMFTRHAVRCVLVELNFVELYAGQANPTDVIAFLRGHGLQLVDFYEKCRHNPHLAWCTALFATVPPS